MSQLWDLPGANRSIQSLRESVQLPWAVIPGLIISGPSDLPENGRVARKMRGFWNWSDLELTLSLTIYQLCAHRQGHFSPVLGTGFPRL